MRADMIRLAGWLLIGTLLATFILLILGYIGVPFCLRGIYHQPNGIKYLFTAWVAGYIMGVLGGGVGGLLTFRFGEHIVSHVRAEQRLRAGIYEGALIGYVIGNLVALYLLFYSR